MLMKSIGFLTSKKVQGQMPYAFFHGHCAGLRKKVMLLILAVLTHTEIRSAMQLRLAVLIKDQEKE